MLHQTRVVDHRFINAPTSIKAQRDARTGGGIGFATSERVENGLPGVLGGPYCGKATGSIEFNHGAIGLTVKVVYPKTA